MRREWAAATLAQFAPNRHKKEDKQGGAGDKEGIPGRDLRGSRDRIKRVDGDTFNNDLGLEAARVNRYTFAIAHNVGALDARFNQCASGGQARILACAQLREGQGDCVELCLWAP